MSRVVHPYDEIYLSDNIITRGSLFAQVSRDTSGWDFSHFYREFMRCKTIAKLDISWPRYACLNGVELRMYLEEEEPHLFIKGEHPWSESAAEWAGWFLAYHQWYWNVSSPKLGDFYTTETLLRMYPGAHTKGLGCVVEDENPAYWYKTES